MLLYRDKDVASVYQDYQEQPLLYRAGGYWWDGTTWYRPDQIWDTASEDWYHRPVPATVTVTAAHMHAADTADATRGRLLSEANPDMAVPSRWLDDLARWAQQHPEGFSLQDSVVTLTAPELAVDQMVSVAEMAQIGGIAASTLRAYIARGEGEVPFPQAVTAGRSLWARPVAEDWAQARLRSPEGITLAVSADRDGETMPVGLADLRSPFARIFYSYLWEPPAIRKRWALRWRTEAAVRDVADDLGWTVAANLRDIILLDALSMTIEHAVLDDLANGKQLDNDIHEMRLRDLGPGEEPPDHDPVFYGIPPGVAMMLGWLVRTAGWRGPHHGRDHRRSRTTVGNPPPHYRAFPTHRPEPRRRTRQGHTEGLPWPRPQPGRITGAPGNRADGLGTGSIYA